MTNVTDIINGIIRIANLSLANSFKVGRMEGYLEGYREGYEAAKRDVLQSD